ncbi:hypothetical protein [Hyphomonas oceanitis]|uniref:Transmembrane protein n=1 Tax=Hyphomonas oceanitis SCH89 TaxID=1280953 RepID=A0A059G8W8_9PROT|nr:hypothetical protein [Hyphomonas oceanitis]KDA02883.1 hypothetical protein HOC_08057 [Hyphomonas oceanitis SCH89]
MSILTYMDFPNLPPAQKKKMEEIEDRLREPGGRLPSVARLRERLQLLKDCTPAIERRQRVDFLIARATVLIAIPVLLIVYGKPFGFTMNESTKNLLLISTMVPVLTFGTWNFLKYRKLPLSTEYAQLEIQLIESILNRRDHAA